MTKKKKGTKSASKKKDADRFGARVHDGFAIDGTKRARRREAITVAGRAGRGSRVSSYA